MKSFIICSTQRSGSTLFCEILKETKHLGNPTENLLYYEYPSNQLSDVDNKLKCMNFNDSLLEISKMTKTSNDVCSIKFMMSTLESISQQEKLTKEGYEDIYLLFKKYFYQPKYIFWSRKNKIKQSVSHAYLRKTGREMAHAKNEEEALIIKKKKDSVKLTNEDIFHDLLYFIHHENKWNNFFSINHLSPLRISFEDFLMNKQEYIKKISKFLNISDEFILELKDKSEPLKRVSNDNQKTIELEFLDFLDQSMDNIDLIKRLLSEFNNRYSINMQLVDLLREFALATENYGNLRIACKIMLQAKKLRPDGSTINKKLEEYKSLLNQDLLKEGIEGINKVGHRDYVGGKWEEIGNLQFNFITSQGLKPENTLLDIACGSLRAGVHFIDYLDKGNYLGIDKEKDLITLGLEKELGIEKKQEKEPEFIVNDSFDFSEFSKIPDYSIAQSLFTHLIEKDIKLCLKNLKNFVGNKPHKFFATFFEVDTPTKGDLEYSHSHACFYYTKEQMENFAKETGWNFEYIGNWNHPRDQKMFLFFKESN